MGRIVFTRTLAWKAKLRRRSIDTRLGRAITNVKDQLLAFNMHSMDPRCFADCKIALEKAARLVEKARCGKSDWRRLDVEDYSAKFNRIAVDYRRGYEN